MSTCFVFSWRFIIFWRICTIVLALVFTAEIGYDFVFAIYTIMCSYFTIGHEAVYLLTCFCY